jgi:hypothetical protein
MPYSMRKKRKSASLAKLEVLADKYFVKPSENYKGLSYGDLTSSWLRWLLSDVPDQYDYGDILFLRGSIGHHNSISNYLKSSVMIPQGVAILVPIVTTHFFMGDRYNGITISEDVTLRKAVREHVDAAGPFWATLEIDNKKVVKLVPTLDSFRIESPVFELQVSEKNPFLELMDEPNSPGVHKALVGGYFVLLHNLPVGTYRIRFGGYGMDKFYTESLYKIDIMAKKIVDNDVSGPEYTPKHLQHEKRNVISTKIK